MPEDRDERVVRLPDDQMAALGDALREGAVRTPPAASRPPTVEIMTGNAAAELRRFIENIIDDILSRRQVLSERDIRVIAKDVAHAIYKEAISGVEERLRGFFTEEGIERIVLRILKDAGIKADKDHAEATREIIEGMFRGYKRRSAIGDDFLKEFVKAIAGLSIAAVAGGVGTYIALVIKGVVH